jgi:hypothetical protein
MLGHVNLRKNFISNYDIIFLGKNIVEIDFSLFPSEYSKIYDNIYSVSLPIKQSCENHYENS